MKPMNFPERKNRRRKRALERENNGYMATENTEKKIVENEREVRTKKYRGK